jgi:hypothetical protein
MYLYLLCTDICSQCTVFTYTLRESPEAEFLDVIGTKTFFPSCYSQSTVTLTNGFYPLSLLRKILMKTRPAKGFSKSLPQTKRQRLLSHVCEQIEIQDFWKEVDRPAIGLKIHWIIYRLSCGFCFLL